MCNVIGSLGIESVHKSRSTCENLNFEEDKFILGKKNPEFRKRTLKSLIIFKDSKY